MNVKEWFEANNKLLCFSGCIQGSSWDDADFLHDDLTKLFEAAQPEMTAEDRSEILNTVSQRVSEAAQPKWADIESAPDDGTYVLILGDDDTIDIASYNRADGWQFKDEQCPSRHCYPTHWYPRPEPPK